MDYGDDDAPIAGPSRHREAVVDDDVEMDINDDDDVYIISDVEEKR
jgi:hypothetical protein